MEDIAIDDSSLSESLDSIGDYIKLTLIFDGVNDTESDMGRAMCDRQNSVNDEMEAERSLIQSDHLDSGVLAGLQRDGEEPLRGNVFSGSRVDADTVDNDLSEMNVQSDRNNANDRMGVRALRRETDVGMGIVVDYEEMNELNDNVRAKMKQAEIEPVTEERLKSQNYEGTNDDRVTDCSYRRMQCQRSARYLKNGQTKSDQTCTDYRYSQCPTENRSSSCTQSDPNSAKRLSQWDSRNSPVLDKCRNKVGASSGTRSSREHWTVDIDRDHEATRAKISQSSSGDYDTVKGYAGSCCLKYLLTVIVLVLCAGGGVGLYFAATSHTVKEQVADEDRPMRLAVSEAVKHYDGEEVFGRYTIDMQRLKDNQELRFITRDDIQNSGVAPSDSDSCVYVSSDGMYKIESQVTFKFNSQLPGPMALHAIVLKTGPDETERTQVKRPVLAGKQNLEGRETILQASNINVLSYLRAGEQICVSVNPISNVYNSRIDNILDIEKRFDIASD